MDIDAVIHSISHEVAKETAHVEVARGGPLPHFTRVVAWHFPRTPQYDHTDFYVANEAGERLSPRAIHHSSKVGDVSLALSLLGYAVQNCKSEECRTHKLSKGKR